MLKIFKAYHIENCVADYSKDKGAQIVLVRLRMDDFLDFLDFNLEEKINDPSIYTNMTWHYFVKLSVKGL